MPYAQTLSAFYSLHRDVFDRLSDHTKVSREYMGSLWHFSHRLLRRDVLGPQASGSVAQIAREAQSREATKDTLSALSFLYNTARDSLGHLLASSASYRKSNPTLDIQKETIKLIDRLEPDDRYRVWSVTLYFLTLYLRAALVESGHRAYHAYFSHGHNTTQVYRFGSVTTEVNLCVPMGRVVTQYFEENISPGGVAYRWDFVNDTLALLGTGPPESLSKREDPDIIVSPHRMGVAASKTSP